MHKYLRNAGTLTAVLALALCAGCVAPSAAEEETMGDENTAEAEQAFGTEFWVYGQRFTGTPGVLLPDCEVYDDTHRLDEYGGDDPVTIIGLESTEYAVPNSWAWEHSVRYDLGQQESNNGLAMSLAIAACATGALVTLQGYPSWYLVNYGQ